jgi:hypothetical protein
MATRFWTNQTVLMQTVIGSPVNITAITKATNGSVSTGTLPTANAYVLLEITGMRQLHRRVVRVSSPAGGAFTIGVDTTAFDDFVSGTYRLLTMGAAFTSLRDLASSGGDPVFEDTTTIHDADDNQAIVSSSPLSYSGTSDWEPSDPALKEANKAYVTRSPRAVALVDPDGSQYLFYAYVNAPLQPTVSGKKKVTPVAFSLLAPGTAYTA